jgi:hypothetical protein
VKLSKRFSKWILGIFVLFGFSYICSCLYFKFTDGFRIGNITPHITFKESWKVSQLSPEEQKTLDLALNQNYRYFAKGHQIYAFISEDGEYLIKFPKFQRITPKPWIYWLPIHSSWESWRRSKIAKKDKVVDNFMNSWKLSYEELKNETAVLYVHINPTYNEINKKLTFTDKLGFKHIINMDEMVFLIQRKVKMFIPAIEQYTSVGDLEGAKKLLDNLLALYVSENQRGLVEKDYQIMRNTGFIGQRPIQIDIGRFFKDENVKKTEVSRAEMRYKTQKLMPWLVKNHPQLALYLDEQIKNLYKKQ